MDKLVTIEIDGKKINVKSGKNLVESAKENGIFIPTLCHFYTKEHALGTCRICTVNVNNKLTTACTVKVFDGMRIEINTQELINARKAIVEMLYAEGNHFCTTCEKSGNCDLQNLSYDMGITISRFPHVFSDKIVDFNSKKIVMEANRCILCKRCVDEIKTKDDFNVFSFVQRGVKTTVKIDYEQEEKLTAHEALKAMNTCPVGAILVKGMVYEQPFGDRKYDYSGSKKEITPPKIRQKTSVNRKFIVATTSLAGCFGCHMSLLDIDEELIDLIELIEFNKSPLTDIKTFTKHCDVGIIEGGCANSENIHILKEFRKNCDLLIVIGECSIMGGVPAMRNFVPLKECLEEAYIFGVTSELGANIVPQHQDIPKLLNNVYPCNEIVKIDYYIPGCPPNANHIWKVIKNILLEEEFSIEHEEFKYD